jgi:hypothetical protein
MHDPFELVFNIHRVFSNLLEIAKLIEETIIKHQATRNFGYWKIAVNGAWNNPLKIPAIPTIVKLLTVMC